MRRFRFRVFIIILAATVTIAGFERPAIASSQNPIYVSVLFFNDIHGHL